MAAPARASIAIGRDAYARRRADSARAAIGGAAVAGRGDGRHFERQRPASCHRSGLLRSDLSLQRSHALDRAREWTAGLSAWCDAQPQLVAFAGACLVHRSEILQFSGAWSEAFEERTGWSRGPVASRVTPATPSTSRPKFTDCAGTGGRRARLHAGQREWARSASPVGPPARRAGSPGVMNRRM